MEWTDRAIVLSSRLHGETAAIVTVLSSTHGKHAGLVHGGGGARGRTLYQPGNEVEITWRGRLSEHLGTFQAELVSAWPSAVLDDGDRLAALASACAVAEAALPERESYAPVFEGLRALFDALTGEVWQAAYIGWELALLRELGFGLDLGSCAATGTRDDLRYVSPRTGRAVSGAAGAAYKGRLLPLPGFLVGLDDAEPARAFADGVCLTGYFLDRHIWAPASRREPGARTRFIDRIAP